MHPTGKPPALLQKQIEVLRKRALGYPETREDFPWGHSAFKVKDKAFVFLYADAEGCSLSVKLPESNALALQLPFAEPTGYGLGKSGWVSAGFKAKDKLPLSLLADWIDESYRAVAPKRLLVQFLLARGPAREQAQAPKPATSKGARKPAASKATRTAKPATRTAKPATKPTQRRPSSR
jgi:predicted DNA-binding protein (MmcQ/YjbR family)